MGSDQRDRYSFVVLCWGEEVVFLLELLPVLSYFSALHAKHILFGHLAKRRLGFS